MAYLETLQEELFDLLASLNFANKYYGYYETHFEIKSITSVSFDREFFEASLLASGLDFRFNEDEEVFEYVDKRNKLEINLKCTLKDCQVACVLVLKTRGRAVEWPFWGLAAEVELLRDPDFEYFPRNPKLPVSNLEDLQEAINFGVALYRQIREELFVYAENEKNRAAKKRFWNRAAA
jgi:hypothetical protein